MIDSHHHLWALAEGPYEFPRPDDALLYRDMLVEELAESCRPAGVNRTIVVQTSALEWETEYLLGLAKQTDLLAGVVGWCDLEMAGAGATLDRYIGLGPLVGIRPMLQRYDDVSFMLDKRVSRSLDEVVRRGLAFDALVDVRHLEIIAQLADLHPELRIVIDHMGKPWRAPQDFARWTAGMQALGKRVNCSVKLSGFPFNANDGQPWHDYAGICRSLHDWFGSARLMWGTDWPLLTRHARYAEAVAAISRMFRTPDIDMIGTTNAQRIYRLAA